MLYPPLVTTEFHAAIKSRIHPKDILDEGSRFRLESILYHLTLEWIVTAQVLCMYKKHDESRRMNIALHALLDRFQMLRHGRLFPLVKSLEREGNDGPCNLHYILLS